MNKPLYLRPEEIHPVYEGYPGPYMIGFEHLKRIFPRWEDPHLTEQIGQIRGRDRLSYWGMMDPDEANILIGIVRATQPATIFEIGTGYGVLTKYLAEATSPNCTVHTLDILPSKIDTAKFTVDACNKTYVPPGDDEIGKAYKNVGLEGRIMQHYGDSAIFDFSPFNGKIDVVIVDANHGYEAAQNDLGKALEIVSPGGVVVVDDFDKMHHLAGVVYAVLTEIAENGRIFYHVYNHAINANPSYGPQSHVVFHPNIPEAIRKNGG